MTQPPAPSSLHAAFEKAIGEWLRSEDYALPLLNRASQIIKGLEARVSESGRSGMSVEELNYLLISTAPDGQWADQAVHSYCATIRARVGAPTPNSNDERKP